MKMRKRAQSLMCTTEKAPVTTHLPWRSNVGINQHAQRLQGGPRTPRSSLPETRSLNGRCFVGVVQASPCPYREAGLDVYEVEQELCVPPPLERPLNPFSDFRV